MVLGVIWNITSTHICNYIKMKIAKSLGEFREATQFEGDLNVFFSENYAAYCSGGALLYVFSENYIIPVVVSEKLVFHWCRFTSEPYEYKEGGESMKLFLNAVCVFLKKELKIQWITITPASSFFSDVPDGSVSVPFGSHVIDLSLDEDKLFSNIHSKHRNVIKKAEKDGVVIEHGTSEKLIEDYHKIDIQTWERSSRKASGEDSLRGMVNMLKDNIIIYMAYKDGEPQSGAIFFFNKVMCYYMHGANKHNPLTGSGNLLQWQAIKDMKAAGVQKYSFVGCRINEDENSKYHGIQRFKERFGGGLIQGYVFKMILNGFYYHLFGIINGASSLIKHGKVIRQKDIVDEEIHKWR